MTFSLGTVSNGTLKTDDLLNAFADELEHRTAAPAAAIRELITDARAYAKLFTEDHLNEAGQECAAEIIGEVMDALTELAPAFVSFGAHDGDGADFGFWPSIDALEEAVRDGDVLKVTDTGDIPASWQGLVMQVSDHGNVTLYHHQDIVGRTQGTLTELWSCV